jgi:hypothetical protein
VASFCTKCGASAPPDTQFCPNCGTAMGTAAAPAAAPYQAPAGSYQPVTQQPYQPAAPAAYPVYPNAPAPAPTSGGGTALKIVLVIVAVFIGIGLIIAGFVAYGVYRVKQSIHVEGSGDNSKVTINTGAGSISANTGQSYSASELGTDVYPGASKGHGGMKMDLPTGSMISAVFLTSDSKDQVLNFYKSRLGSESSVIDTSNGAIISLKKSDTETVMVTVTEQTSGDEAGKTQVAIVHTKTKK